MFQKNLQEEGEGGGGGGGGKNGTIRGGGGQRLVTTRAFQWALKETPMDQSTSYIR